MASFGIDRETLLDLTVNVIPLGIILLFAVVAVVVAPLGRPNLLTELVELGLLAVPFVVLAVVSYLAGRAVMLDEDREGEAEIRGPPHSVESAVGHEAAGTSEGEAAEGTDEEVVEPAPGTATSEPDDATEPPSRSETEGEP